MPLPDPITNVPSQQLDKEVSALCSERIRPIVITGALLWLIRRHFADANNIVDAALREYVWDADTEKSTITIESITKFSGASSQAVQLRPAVYVKRNVYRPQRISIGDRFHGRRPGLVPVDSGGRNYAVDTADKFGLFIGGSHTFFCVGGAEAEAEAVGTEVFFELVEFTPLIRRDLDFHRFFVTEMGPAQRLEESDEHWAVPIVVVYAFEHDWLLRPEEPLLKTISINTDEL